MQEERVARDIHVFTSELYAQVTAGLIVTEEGCILIDTLPFPEETAELALFASDLCPSGVQLVVLTHYHADHTYGTYQFPNATVVGHELTRHLLIERGLDALAQAKSEAPDLADVELVLPTVVFGDGELTLHLGGKTVQLLHSPGHTLDSIACLVMEDRVLFASDTMLPVPTIFDGDLDTLVVSLERLKELPVDSIVQGHGEVILRGEVNERVDQSVAYLHRIRDLVSKMVAQDQPRDSLWDHDIESCGLSRIPLNGLVQDLHYTNLRALYNRMAKKETAKV
jgi:cyclase